MSRRTAALVFAVVAAACLLAACGADKDEPASTLGKAERDSVLSESVLPGASAVQGALSVADSAQARADRSSAAAAK